MKLSKYSLLLGLAIILALQICVFAQTETETFVKKFYQFHNSRNGVLSLHELKLHQRFFTNELNKLFLNELKRQDEFTRKNHNDKPHFGDGLPFKPFEECVVKGKFYPNDYEVSEFSNDANVAIVEVKFYQPKECDSELIDTYKIELLKKGKIWLINDWIYSDDSKLTDDLNRKDY
jgi:hypothetical protein